ncbi:MAG: catechol 2,3-dioxygenase-like lactoylglutathione lyase family enzyme [Candidatus Azotimanducaceae bacterium]|jgi:catechol 2,3-dioxygenase-like lactoylglutathione lyase family enzyme
MELAKNVIDIGIFTNQREEQMAFWQEQVGLPFEELLKTGGGAHQLRHGLNGSVFKMNHTREPLGRDDSTGYQELLIARQGLEEPIQLKDPDGNLIRLVPVGWQGVEQIGIVIKVSDLAKFRNFYRKILQIEEVSETSFRWGSTIFFLEQSDNTHRCEGIRGGIGYRYLTVQVWQVDEEHRAFINRGGTEAQAPMTLGTTARISFITDPDGNWIEISQRASLTGSIE